MDPIGSVRVGVSARFGVSVRVRDDVKVGFGHIVEVSDTATLNPMSSIWVRVSGMVGVRVGVGQR